MKKHLFLILVILFISIIQSQAQISAGFQARLSGYKLSEPSRKYLTSFKPGFEFGGFIRIGLEHKLYIQPEAGFSYISGKIDPENEKNVYYKNCAFSLPILVGITAVESKDANFRVYLGLGNTFSIFNSIGVMNEALEEYLPTITPSHKLKSPSYEISGIIGIGFDISDISIDLRYGRTFNYTVKRDGDKFYQNTFSIALGYKLVKP